MTQLGNSQVGFGEDVGCDPFEVGELFVGWRHAAGVGVWLVGFAD
jgi:hypothetical protein